MAYSIARQDPGVFRVHSNELFDMVYWLTIYQDIINLRYSNMLFYRTEPIQPSLLSHIRDIYTIGFDQWKISNISDDKLKVPNYCFRILSVQVD